MALRVASDLISKTELCILGFSLWAILFGLMGGGGSRVITHGLSNPAHPPKKKMCRNNRMIIDFCFSARNDVTVFPTLDIKLQRS